jgi:hypothetical protein
MKRHQYDKKRNFFGQEISEFGIFSMKKFQKCFFTLLKINF